ncbi:MAG: hypothetical protein ACP5RT_02670 [Candidatus Micrarchaeia archaeon]
MQELSDESSIRAKLLLELYKDARISVSSLSKKLGINYYKTRTMLKSLDDEKELKYTIQINCRRLGFDVERFIFLKFDSIPDEKLLQSEFAGDVFIQNAYLLKGDFDVLLHVVKASNTQYLLWAQMLRIRLSKYGPTLIVSDKAYMSTGFLPILSELINLSKVLNDKEKRILVALNENSRESIRNISNTYGFTYGMINRTIRSLIKRGILLGMTSLIRESENRIMLVFALHNLKLGYRHQACQNNVLKKLISNDSMLSRSKYDIIAHTSGYFDMLFMFEYKNGSEYYEFGPVLWQKAFVKEEVKIQEATLIKVLKGYWPIHPKEYEGVKNEINSKTMGKADYDRVNALMKIGKVNEALDRYYKTLSEVDNANK